MSRQARWCKGLLNLYMYIDRTPLFSLKDGDDD